MNTEPTAIKTWRKKIVLKLGATGRTASKTIIKSLVIMYKLRQLYLKLLHRIQITNEEL